MTKRFDAKEELVPELNPTTIKSNKPNRANLIILLDVLIQFIYICRPHRGNISLQTKGERNVSVPLPHTYVVPIFSIKYINLKL